MGSCPFDEDFFDNSERLFVIFNISGFFETKIASSDTGIPKRIFSIFWRGGGNIGETEWDDDNGDNDNDNDEMDRSSGNVGNKTCCSRGGISEELERIEWTEEEDDLTFLRFNSEAI